MGALVLKRLVDHAYGSKSDVDDDLAGVLNMMKSRLLTAGPKTVSTQAVKEWLVFTDAAYDKESKDGGLGAVLVSASGDCAAWFSLKLDTGMCEVFGACDKETIIYELEMLAACLAFDVWSGFLRSSYSVHYGDNDSVRYALIRGTGLGTTAGTIMRLHLQTEVDVNSCLWFARVPTEANIADVPSRGETHPFLESKLDVSSTAADCLERFLVEVQEARQLKFKRGRCS